MKTLQAAVVGAVAVGAAVAVLVLQKTIALPVAVMAAHKINCSRLLSRFNYLL
jgi:hypothetical protein